MKKMLFLLLVVASTNIYAQVTDTIDVCFDKSCYLVFDSSVKFDFGSQGIIVRDAGNKIIIQAAEEDFPETNLLVQCGSEYFLFIIRYNEAPKKLFFNYQNKSTQKINNSSKVGVGASKPIKNSELNDYTIINKKKHEQFVKDSLNAVYVPNCEKVMHKTQDVFNRGSINGKIQFALTNLYISKGNMYLKLSITNKSKIPYNIGFIESKVETVKRTVKGSADQVVGIEPLFVFNNGGVVEGRKSLQIVVVIKQVAIQHDKKLVVDMWEDNGALDSEGGRKASISIMSNDILNIKELK